MNKLFTILFTILLFLVFIELHKLYYPLSGVLSNLTTNKGTLNAKPKSFEDCKGLDKGIIHERFEPEYDIGTEYDFCIAELVKDEMEAEREWIENVVYKEWDESIKNGDHLVVDNVQTEGRW